MRSIGTHLFISLFLLLQSLSIYAGKDPKNEKAVEFSLLDEVEKDDIFDISELFSSPDPSSDSSVLSVLGLGSFGLVLFVQGEGRTPVALKMIRPSILQDQASDRYQSALRALQREQRFFECMRGVDSSHLLLPLLPLEVGYMQGRENWLFFPVCKGDLASYLKSLDANLYLGESKIRCHFYSLLRGLQDLFSRGFVHRDVKTENLLFDENDQLKLADFGFAIEDGYNFIAVPRFCGTPVYMCPEVFSEEQIPLQQVDLYAAAIVLYELYTKRTPYKVRFIRIDSVVRGVEIDPEWLLHAGASRDHLRLHLFASHCRIGHIVADLMSKLLCTNQGVRERRYSSLRQIYSHPYFWISRTGLQFDEHTTTEERQHFLSLLESEHFRSDGAGVLMELYNFLNLPNMLAIIVAYAQIRPVLRQDASCS